jgi:hypothetical protein
VPDPKTLAHPGEHRQSSNRNIVGEVLACSSFGAGKTNSRFDDQLAAGHERRKLGKESQYGYLPARVNDRALVHAEQIPGIAQCESRR